MEDKVLIRNKMDQDNKSLERKVQIFLYHFHKRSLGPIIIIFLLAFTVRLIYNLTAANHYIPIFDAGLYDALGRNLLSKHCYCIHGNYATISRAPLWPWILAIIYSLSGEQAFYARLFYCFLGSGTCLITYSFARDLFGKRVAFCVGTIAACYTGLFLYDGWLYTESLYTFCLTGFTYALFRVQKSYQSSNESSDRRSFWYSFVQYRWIILSGLLLGAAVLTRPNGSALFGIVCLWGILLIFLKQARWKHLIKHAIMVMLIAAVIIVPWTYRNYRVSHQFVLVATGMGEVLIGSYNDGALAKGGIWSPPAGSKIHDEVGYTTADDKDETQQALAWIQLHMNEMPYLLSLHFVNMWKPYTYSHGLPMEEFPTRFSSRLLFLLIPIQSIPIFLLALVGLLGTLHIFRRELLTVYLVMIMTIAENVVFYSDMRFRAPIEPLLVIFVGGTFWLLCRRVKKTLSLVKARIY